MKERLGGAVLQAVEAGEGGGGGGLRRRVGGEMGRGKKREG